MNPPRNLHPAAKEPTWINYWGWGSGDMLGAGAQAVITGWLFYFFTTFCGLSAVDAGLILGLPRLLEAITCPLIGYVSDNLRHTWVGRKIGRRKLFLLITIPLLPSFALIFRTGHTFTYYLLAFIFFELLYTMFLIPWETLAAEMTKDYKAKAKFAGARMIVAQSSAILASYLPTLLISQFGGKDSPDTFFWMAAIFGCIFSVVVTIVVLTTWERPYGTREQAVMSQTYGGFNLKAALLIPVKMFRDLFSTLKIRAFRQHLSIYLGGYLSQDIFNSAFAFFVATVLMGATLVISQLMTVMYVAQLISVMVAIQIVIRTGPVLAYRLAGSLFAAALLLYLGFYLARPEGFAESFNALGTNLFGALNPASPGFSLSLVFWIFVPIVLAGLGRGTLNFVPWSVYNYLPDVDEAVTGQRREGIFAGVMTLVRKLAQSAAIMASGWIIDLGGYVKTKPGEVVVQTPEAIQTVTLLMVGGPLLMLLLGALASWKFRLNASTHAVLVHEVERLRNGATEAESDENRRIVEDLTGWPYDRLWGRGSGHADSSLQPLQARP
ncbi:MULTISPECIES: MFS transporter [Roseateles]|uniref:Oligogalacturonide transporter n=1 Tax=Pelomonas aquatica TaxID=431058 RepID=A0ABU1ZBC6_9BURK|nr:MULTISPECIES: MFS transporter [Roseateles]KQY88971.1 MFS transporter [Pelomonas sp. Root1444]MDR7297920.1 oligogalacturonide transporter [Pelomonas aquatica]